MNGLPPKLNKVIESFTRFPGIGEKTAHRLGLHVLKSQNNEIEEFRLKMLKMMKFDEKYARYNGK